MVKQRTSNSKNISSKKTKFKSQASKDSFSSSNPFDRLDNSKKKYEVVNRRLKGDKRDVGKARNKALNDRKSNLLQEFKSLKKSNNFIDKRFGETDNSMSLEDKMFLRFQKEKINKIRNNNIYNLDNDNEILTHKGQYINDTNLNDNDFIDDNNNDEDEMLNKDIVSQLHFGGFVPSSKSNNDLKISKYDTLKDIINKSKIIKQQRKEVKDELDDQRNNLDSLYKELLSDSLLEFKSNKYSRDSNLDTSTEAVDEYDKSLIEMLFDSKVKASDRIKSDEEIAKENIDKLEKLEKARLERMKDKSIKNKSTSKNKNLTDDQIMDDFASNDKIVDNRNNYNKDADSDDELSDDGNSEGDEDDDDDDDEEDDENEEDSNDEEENGDSDDYEEDNFDDLLDNADTMKLPTNSVIQPKQQNKSTNLQKEKTNKTFEKISNKLESNDKKITSNFNERDDIIPHILPCPSTIESFIELLQQYEREHTDFETIISRIVIYHSVFVAGQQGVENRVAIHNFLDVLLKYIVCIGNQLIETNINTNDIMSKINYLTSIIFKIHQDISDVVPALWGRTLKIINQQSQKRYRDYALGKCDSTWPSLGQMILFQMVNQFFSVSDWINGVSLTSTLIQCQCLMTCPINEVIDIYSGLFITSILIDSINQSKRIIPEVMTFLSTLIALFLPSKQWSCPSLTILKTCNVSKFIWLRESLNKKYENEIVQSKLITWNEFTNQSKISSSIFHSIYSLINILSSYYDSLSGYPELFHNILTNLALMNISNDEENLSETIISLHESTYNLLLNNSTRIISTRKPLQWRIPEVESIKPLPPRYIIDYKMNKTLIGDSNGLMNKQVNDSIKSKQQLKQLKKQLKRENKATIRELRRDGQFINQVQYQEKQSKKQELQQERWDNFKWLEQQQAEVNSYVKKLKGTLKGGGSNSIKKTTKRKKR